MHTSDNEHSPPPSPLLHTQAIVSSRRLICALWDGGEHACALFLAVVGRAFEGMDMSEQNSKARSVKIHARTLICSRLLGNLLFRPGGNGGSSLPMHAGGVTIDNLLSWMFSADA